MPGKLYDGRDKSNAKNGVPQHAKGFCEGMAYRASGTETTRPKSNNPHQSGSELAAAWDNGWDTAESAKGSTLTREIAQNCSMGDVTVAAAS